MKKLFLGFLALVLFVAVGGTFWILLNKNEKTVEKLISVAPFKADIYKKVIATGTIVPRKEIEVKSNLSGIISEILVKPGDQVRAGQLLAKLRIIPDALALSQAESVLKLAQLSVQQDQEELQRQQALFDKKLLSVSQIRDLILRFEKRKQELEAAQVGYEVVKEGASKKSGNFATQILATVTGMVLEVPVRQGTFVIETNAFNSGTTIAEIANMNEMVFEGKIDEAEVGLLREGMALKLTVGALSEQSFDASLEFIAPKGLQEEGAVYFPLRAAIQNPGSVFLRAGYSANAEIILEEKIQVLAIKESELIFEKGKTYVQVINSNGIENREIQTGLSDGIQVEILEGLKEGEQIKKQ